MKIVALNISKRESFDPDYPNEIVGVVQAKGANGKMEVILKPKTVAEIFRICREDAQQTANSNASMMSQACDVAADTIALQVENGDRKQLS